MKFCGITRAEDAGIAVGLGVDALGFVLVPRSPRYLAPEAAAAIRRQLPAFVSAVALFQDADAEFVRSAIAQLRPDLLQFHGAEAPEFCSAPGLPYVKAVSMREPSDLAAVEARYADARALLLDSHAIGSMGGSGRSFDWNSVERISKPLVLAGGLNPENVGQALRQLRPYAVDVSSGIESQPGVKDAGKMRAFVDAVRRADEADRSRSC